MMQSLSTALLLSSLARATLLSPHGLTIRTTPDCIPCNPDGWRSADGPAIGPDMIPLYVNLVHSVKTIRFKQKNRRDDASWTPQHHPHHPHELHKKRATAPICCTDGAQCVLLSELLIPFCYDKYTTNFLFPDGSRGNIASGIYNTTNPGESIDLLTGNVTNSQPAVYYEPALNGSNIYAANATARPNTATLQLPPVYTAAGDGSRITSLGHGGSGAGAGHTTHAVTTVPARTIAPVTIAAFTGSDGVLTPARTIAGTTIPAITVAAVESRAAAVQLRRPEDAARLERIATMYAAVMGVFGGLAMLM